MMMIRKMGWLTFGLCLLVRSELLAQPNSSPSPHGQILVVVGAAGEEEYGNAFRQWLARWKAASKNWDYTEIDGTQKETDAAITDRQKVLDWIAKADPQRPRWLVLIGHGTSNQKVSKFNLRGPDLSGEDLSKALDARPGNWVVIDCASCSGPFLPALSKPDRVIVSATKSAAELNYCRFGDYFSKAISDPSSDLDHDETVSVLEAFLSATSQVNEFYRSENRLASEHSLIDDNGDKQGTAATFFRGVRVVKGAEKGKQVDGKLANKATLQWQTGSFSWTEEQIAKRDAIEAKIEEIRRQKSELSEANYYEQLEPLFVELAKMIAQ